MYSQKFDDLPVIGRTTHNTLALLDMPYRLLQNAQIREIGLEGRTPIDTYSPNTLLLNTLTRTERFNDDKWHYFPAYVLGKVQDIDIKERKLLAFTRETVKSSSDTSPFFQHIQTVDLEEIILFDPLTKELVEKTA